MLRAEVEHLLRLADAPDVRPREDAGLAGEDAEVHLRRVLREPDVDQHPVGLEQLEQRVQVHPVGHRGDDEVEGAAERAHVVLVRRRHVARGAERQPVVALGEAPAQHDGLRAHGGCDLHAHVPQPAHADDAHPLAGSGTPALERGVEGDARAHQRRGVLERHLIGDPHGVVLLDGDARRVAARRGKAVAAGAVVGPDRPRAPGAELLLALSAHVALPAGVHETADADAVSHLELRHLGTHLADHAGDLVPADEGVVDAAPLLARGVDVGMADAGVGDVEVHLGGAGLAAGDGGLLVAAGGRINGVGSDVGHGFLHEAGGWGVVASDATPMRLGAGGYAPPRPSIHAAASAPGAGSSAVSEGRVHVGATPGAGPNSLPPKM